jgi:hypothetical protein
MGGQVARAFDDVLVCDVTEPCDTVSVGAAECPSLTSESLVCMLESLRDRVPGRYSASSNVCSAIGTMSTREVIIVHDDGSVTTASCGSSFTSLSECGEAKQCALKSPEYFDDCLAMSAEFRPGNQIPCASLSSALTDCLPAPVRCE